RFNGRLAVLYIDAHPDLNDSSRRSRWSNGCALRRGLELAEVDPRKVVLIGQRDYDWEEVDFIRRAGVTLITGAEANRLDPARFKERLESVIGDDALHVSLDIDVLDPSGAPGTGIPAAGGLTSRQLLDLLHALRGLRLAGMDLDEVSPPLDMGHVTVLSALKCILVFMGHVLPSRRLSLPAHHGAGTGRIRGTRAPAADLRHGRPAPADAGGGRRAGPGPADRGPDGGYVLPQRWPRRAQRGHPGLRRRRAPPRGAHRRG